LNAALAAAVVAGGCASSQGSGETVRDSGLGMSTDGSRDGGAGSSGGGSDSGGSSGGRSDSGGSSSGGSDGGGSGGGGGDGGRSEGGGSGGGNAKFCNLLQKTGATNFTATLTIGTATASALSYNCAPVGGCFGAPAGSQIPVSVNDGSTEIISGNFGTVLSGDVLFLATTDSSGNPTVLQFSAAGLCAESSPGSGEASIKLCNGLVHADGTPVTESLTANGLTSTASSQQCAPCAAIPAGVGVPYTGTVGVGTVSGTLGPLSAGMSQLVMATIDPSTGNAANLRYTMGGLCGAPMVGQVRPPFPAAAPADVGFSGPYTSAPPIQVEAASEGSSGLRGLYKDMERSF
jgi:hypothetical protein